MAVGFSLMGAGLLAVLLAGLIAWSAFGRWQAVAELREAQSQMRRDRPADARRIAAAALARVPEDAAAALLACDPTDPAAIERLVAMAPRLAKRDERNAVLATVAIARLQAGKPADVDLEGTADGRLISAMSAALAGRTPGPLYAAGEDPPHLQVQRVVLTTLLRLAWSAGRADEVRRHAGSLLLMRPRAAEAPTLRAIVAATTPEVADAAVVAMVQEVKAERERLAAALAKLVPARQAAFAAQWPVAPVTGATP
jgi:hypothetical protein